MVVSGRARAIVVGVGSNTAMGSIRDAMLRTEDVSCCSYQLKGSCYILHNYTSMFLLTVYSLKIFASVW